MDNIVKEYIESRPWTTLGGGIYTALQNALQILDIEINFLNIDIKVDEEKRIIDISPN